MCGGLLSFGPIKSKRRQVWKQTWNKRLIDYIWRKKEEKLHVFSFFGPPFYTHAVPSTHYATYTHLPINSCVCVCVCSGLFPMPAPVLGSNVCVCERERETTAYTRSFSSFSRGNSSKQHNKWFDNFLAPSGSLSALVSSRSSLSVLGVRENATRSPRLGLDISPGTGFYIPHGERSKRKNTSSSVFLGR